MNRECKKRLQMPYIVRQRRRRRRAHQAHLAAGSTDSEAAGNSEEGKPSFSQCKARSTSRTPGRRSRFRSHFRSRGRLGSRHQFGSGGRSNSRCPHSRERSDSTVRFHESRTWAEEVKICAQPGAQVWQGNSPEHGKE